MKFSKKIVAIASAAALAIGGVTTAAVAAIPDSDDGEFHACVADTGPVRAMYAIDDEASESCAAGYTEKTWATVAAPEFAATWVTATGTAPCAQITPSQVSQTNLVSLPPGKRGIRAWEQGATFMNNDLSGASSDPSGPDVYHYDAEGRIDGVYVRVTSSGNECTSGGIGTQTATTQFQVYDIS